MSKLALQIIAKEKQDPTGYLDLGRCGLTPDNPQLEEVWTKLGDLVHLETLIFSNEWWEWEEGRDYRPKRYSQNKGELNFLEAIPFVLQKLTQLKKLILTGGYHDQRWSIQKIDGLQKLNKLTQLYISDNQIQKIEGLQQLNNLILLDISNNQIQKIEGLQKLNNLTLLYISNNQIQKIEGLQKLNKLTLLYISYNQIQKIEGLQKLNKLTLLYIRNNQIQKIEGLQQLNKLIQLDISNNQIQKIEGLQQLNKLTRLGISNNQIQKIEGLQQLNKLTLLNLYNNQIQKIEGLEGLHQLKRLDISKTLIQDLRPLRAWISAGIPVKWDYLESGICVLDCPLTTPPVEVVKQGNEAILRYFEELDRTGKTKIREAKLLLTGSGEVGKTSLRLRLKNKGCDLPKQDERTRQVDIDTYTFELQAGELPFTAHVWDFGGQQIIHHFHRFFMNQSALYLLMTETSRENDDFDYWLHTIQLYGKESPVLFVQNKRNGMPRSLDIKPYQAHFNIKDDLYQINLLDNEGLEDLERAIQYHIQSLPLTQRAIPNSWLRVRKALEQHKSAPERYFIRYEKLVEICEREGIDSRAGVQDVGQFLHDLGVILWYHENPTLKQKVILERHWATEGIFKLFFAETIESSGHFTRSQAQAIWDQEKEYCHHCEELIEMMKEFKICFPRKTDPSHYIIPALLPATEPPVGWPVKSHLLLEYRYATILPRGLVNYLSAEMYDYISDDAYVWSTGLWLHKNETYAKIKENRFRRKITIEIGGQQPQELIGAIKKEMDDIHRDYAGIEAALIIPCICSKCLEMPLDQRGTHQYSDVIKIFKRPNKNHIMCLKDYDNVDVGDLLKNILPRRVYDQKAEKQKAKKVFISYAHKDIAFRDALDLRLNPLVRHQQIEEVWFDHQLKAGEDWDARIKRQLQEADLILFLISPDFWASNYINEVELPIAKQRKADGSCEVISILLRPENYWMDSEWSQFQGLPTMAKTGDLIPISQWPDGDAAWRVIIDGIKEVL